MPERIVNFVVYRMLFALGAAVLATAPVAAAGGPGAVPFTEPTMAETYVSDDGTVALAWAEEDADDAGLLIFEARRWSVGSGENEEGVLVYEGPDTATFLSGLPEGVYKLKVRARSPEGDYPAWGDDYLSVEVKYIESWLVVVMMSLGLVTFLAIVGAIVFGHRKASGERVTARSELERTLEPRT